MLSPAISLESYNRGSRFLLGSGKQPHTMTLYLPVTHLLLLSLVLAFCLARRSRNCLANSFGFDSVAQVGADKVQHLIRGTPPPSGTPQW